MMPSWGNIDYRDTSRWIECMRKASLTMVAEGWNKHAKKFHQVQLKRAMRLYFKGAIA